MCTHPPCLGGVRGRDLWLGLGGGEGSGAQYLGGDGRKEEMEEDKKRGGRKVVGGRAGVSASL